MPVMVQLVMDKYIKHSGQTCTGMKQCKHNLLHITKGCYLQKVKDPWSIPRWELVNQTEDMLRQTRCWHPAELSTPKKTTPTVK
jgi:hypothetical protein